MNLLIQLVVLSLVSTATCWAFTAPLDRSSIFLSSSNRQLFHLHDTGIPLTIPPPSPQYSTSSSSLLSLSKSSLFSASSDNENELEHRTDDDNADTADIDTAVPNWKRILLFNKYNTDGSLKSNKEDDDMTFKQKLAKMGLSALLSYGESSSGGNIRLQLCRRKKSRRKRNLCSIAIGNEREPKILNTFHFENLIFFKTRF